MSVKYSDIMFSMKIRKTKSCPKFFHWIYGYQIDITDNHFNNQKDVD